MLAESGSKVCMSVVFMEGNDSQLSNAGPAKSFAPSVKSSTQYSLRGLLIAVLFVGLVVGWIVDHRELQKRRDANAAIMRSCKKKLLKQLETEGIGKSLNDYPEVLLFSDVVYEPRDHRAQQLIAKLVPAGKACKAYRIDLDPGQDSIFTFIVYTVDGTIFAVDDLASEW